MLVSCVCPCVYVHVSGQALDSTSLRTSQALWGGPISSHHTPCQWLVSPPVDWWFSVHGWLLRCVLGHSWCLPGGANYCWPSDKNSDLYIAKCQKKKNKLQTVHCLYRSINYFFWLFSNYLFEFVWIYLMNFTFMLEVSSCFRRILKKNHQATGSLAKPHVSTCEVNTLKIRNSSSVQFYCIFTQYSTTMVQYTNKMLCPN